MPIPWLFLALLLAFLMFLAATFSWPRVERFSYENAGRAALVLAAMVWVFG